MLCPASILGVTTPIRLASDAVSRRGTIYRSRQSYLAFRRPSVAHWPSTRQTCRQVLAEFHALDSTAGVRVVPASPLSGGPYFRLAARRVAHHSSAQRLGLAFREVLRLVELGADARREEIRLRAEASNRVDRVDDLPIRDIFIAFEIDDPK